MNLGQNTEDPKHNVEANRATLTRTFDLPPHQLLTVRQVHGTDILITPRVDLVEPDSLPKSEGKAVRVVDNRKE